LDNTTPDGARPRTKLKTAVIWAVILAADIFALAYLAHELTTSKSPLAADSGIVSDPNIVVERTHGD
jgi:hypothetical protein